MKKFIQIALALILFITSALFFSQNDADVLINYFSGETLWQLNWVMVLCLLIGFFLGLLSLSGSLLKTKLKLKQTQKKLSHSEKELNSLRALPIKDQY
jgi:lipopolysaccharide assembly protein A